MKLIAPNGKPSNLNSVQYKLVRTPEFKEWFGDWENDPKNASKVLDENGEPLVVYRGMPKNRRVGNVFRYNVNLFGNKGVGGRQKNEFAFYFTNMEKVAKNYGENLSETEDGYIVKPYFLNVKNIFEAFTKKNQYETTFKKLYDLANKTDKKIYLKNYKGDIETDYKGNPLEYLNQRSLWSQKYNYGYPEQTFAFFVDWTKQDSNQYFWRNYLEQYLHYDGVVFYEVSQNTKGWDDKKKKYIPQYKDEFSKTYGVWYSNQIKLADGTNTTFDGLNEDIRYNRGGQIDGFSYSIGGL